MLQMNVPSIPCHPPSTQLPPSLLLGLEVHTSKTDLDKSPTWVQEVESGNFRCQGYGLKEGHRFQVGTSSWPLEFLVMG